MSKEIFIYYEKIGSGNADLIVKIANTQFVNGQINYLEWTMLMNNATSIRSGYVDAKYELNSAIIEINYLTTK